MNEEFSIVIPVYNRAEVVKDTLRSIEAQTWRPIHLVLVDNASSDESLRVLEQWAVEHRAPDFRITVASESKRGAPAARNRGLREVESEYMLFFDSDDVLLPDAVTEYMRAFQSEGKPDLVITRSKWCAGDGEEHFLPTPVGDLLLSHLHHSTLRTVSYAVRTSLMRGVGGWNENLFIWDDWELGMRLVLSTDRYVRIPSVGALVHVSGKSITGCSYSQREKYYDAAIEASRKVLMASHRKDVKRLVALMDYRRMLLAALFSREGRPDLARKWRSRALKGASAGRRFTLRLAYAYIRRGGRGFDRLLRFLPL